jgi:hypothetical protein
MIRRCLGLLVCRRNTGEERRRVVVVSYQDHHGQNTRRPTEALQCATTGACQRTNQRNPRAHTRTTAGNTSPKRPRIRNKSCVTIAAHIRRDSVLNGASDCHSFPVDFEEKGKCDGDSQRLSCRVYECCTTCFHRNPTPNPPTNPPQKVKRLDLTQHWCFFQMGFGVWPPRRHEAA